MITTSSKSRPAANQTDKVYFVQTDIYFKITALNASFSQILQLPEKDIQQTRLTDYFQEGEQAQESIKDAILFHNEEMAELTAALQSPENPTVIIKWQLTKSSDFITGKVLLNWWGKEVAEDVLPEKTTLVSNDFSGLFHNSPQPMWVLDKETYKFLAVNMAAVDYYGYNETVFLKMSFADLLPDTDEESTLPNLKKAFASLYKNADKGIWRHSKKNGEACYMHIYAHPVTYNGKEVILVQSTDVSRSVAAEKELLYSKERYESFLNQSTEGIWCFELEEGFAITDPPDLIITRCIKEGRLVDCNEAFAKMYGLPSRESIIGAPLNQMLSLDNWQNVAYLNAFIASGFELRNAESVETDAEGKTKIFLNNLVGIVENGKIKRAWGTQRDVTEQRKIESKDKYLATLMEAAGDILVSVDTNLNIVSWNSVAEKTYGFSEREVLGKKTTDFLQLEYKYSSREFYSKELRENGYWSGEVMVINKWGKKITLLTTVTKIIDAKGVVVGYMGVSKDITDRIEAERSAKFRSEILENLTEGIVFKDLSYNITEFNKAAEDMFGVSKQAIVGKRIRDMIDYQFSDISSDEFLSLVKQNGSAVGEMRFLHPAEKREKIVSVHASEYFNELKEPIGIVLLLKDITEKKAIEEKLKYQARILADISDAIISTDLNDFKIQTWNKAAENIYKISNEEAVGKHINELVQYEFIGTTLQEVTANFLERDMWEGEVSFLRNDGERIFLFSSVSVIKNELGEKIGAVAVNRDITERNKALRALRKKEIEFRTLAENAPTIIHRIDRSLLITYVNKAFLDTYETKLENVTGRPLLEFDTSEATGSKFETAVATVLEKAKSVNYTAHNVAINGKSRDFLITVTPEFNEDREIDSFLVLYNDITAIEAVKKDLELKEQELVASNKRFEFATKATTDSIWELDVKSGKLFITKEFTQLFGYTSEDLQHKPNSWFIERVHPEDRLSVISKMMQVFAQKEEFLRDEYRWMTKKGEYIYILNQSYIFYDAEGHPFKGIGAIKDITEQKKAESLLIQKDILLAASAQGANQLLIEPDFDKAVYKGLQIVGQAVKADRAYLFMASEVDAPEATYYTLIQEWNSGLYESQLSNVLLQHLREADYPELVGTLREGRFHQFHAKNAQRPALKKHLAQSDTRSVLLMPVFADNKFWGFIGFDQCSYERTWISIEIDILMAFSSNITGAIEKQEAKRRLTESEIKFKSLFQNSLDIIFVLDDNYNIKFVTPSVATVLEFSEETITGTNLLDFVVEEDLGKARASFKEIVNGINNPVVANDLRIKRQSGEALWMECKGLNLLEDPVINGIIISFRDISERKQSEHQLQHYSENITNILNSITDGFIAFDYEYRVLWWNPIAEQLTGVKDIDILGKNLWETLPELRETISFEEYNKVLMTRTVSNFELYLPSRRVYFDVNAYPSKQGLFVYFKDITLRKKQEMLLALEKEVLELNANPVSTLTNVLDYFLEGIEKINYEVQYAIVTLKDDNKTLKHLSAPSVNQDYVAAIEGLPIDPTLGSFGAAIYYNREIIVPDIANSPYWQNYHQLAKRFGFVACWAFPVISSSNKVLGALACYYQKPKEPADHMISLLKRVAALSGVIIENKLSEEKVNISNERYLLATKATNDAIWDFDIKNNKLYWGESFYTLFGYKQTEISLKEGFWETKIHPEDRKKAVSIYEQAVNKKDHSIIHLEYRFRKADGKYALISDRSFIVYDNKGEPTRIVGSMQDITERKKLEKKLITQEIEKQKSVAQAVVDAQEKERAEIGKELHDNVNQILSTAKLYLELAKTESKQRTELIKRSADNIFNAINEIRGISKALVPPSVKDLGLIDSIKDMIESLHIAKAIKVKFTHRNYNEEEVSDNIKLMLFRIVQEQVNNVLKHAEAKQLVITLSVKEKNIQLMLADNGKGFDTEKVKFKKGVGLTNIESRASLLNGKINIQSIIGKGTTLTVDVPIHKM